MIDKRILMVVSYDPQTLPNQPFYNVVRCFAGKFREVHYATCTNLYAGPPASTRAKVGQSVHNLLFDRTQVSQERTESGGNVKHLVTRRLKLPHTAQTMVSDFWWIANLPRWLKETHYDLCFYSCPQNTFLPTYLQRRGSAARVVYYDIDYFPDHVDARSHMSRQVLAWREKFAVTHADGVISVSKPLAGLRRKQGARKVITVPNGVALDRFLPARDREPHPPTLLYVGILSEAWGIDLVLQALPLIRRRVPDVRFHVVGGGPYRGQLERLTAELGLQDVVTFFGSQPYNALAPYMRQADVGFALYKSREFVRYASPMKIKDYLAAGLPVITTPIGEAEDIICESGAGELVDYAPESIAAAAIMLLTNKPLADAYRAAAVRYAPRFDWNVVLEPALDFVLSL